MFGNEHSIAAVQDRAPKRKPDEAGQDEVSVGRAGRKTAETLSATDRIIEALELAAKEAERLEVSWPRPSPYKLLGKVCDVR